MESLQDRIIRHEGIRLKIYKDSLGYPTIGIGRNIIKNPMSTEYQDYYNQHGCITKTMALSMLVDDIGACKRALGNELQWFDSLDDIRQGVLIEMAFQMGVTGLLAFKNTLELVERGQYIQASASMLESKWAQQVPARAKELSAIMSTGHET